MSKLTALTAFVLILLSLEAVSAQQYGAPVRPQYRPPAQQQSRVAAPRLYRVPDVRSLKYLTTKHAEHAADIPGKETTANYYSTPDGQVVSVYSFRGKTVAFSINSNTNSGQNFRLFMDLNGDGLFQQVGGGTRWVIPAWAR
jgi:hypothetical protein